MELPPLSLYIHIPWCSRKCPYCDFNVHVQSSVIPEDAYLDALLCDLHNQLPLVQARKLHSVFIGGGTPNLLSADFYARLLHGINRHIDYHPEIEITIEANPGSRQKTLFQRLRNAGMNRISLGIQSFDNETLKILGREHNARDNHLAISAARIAGFDNMNLDLIHATPKQTKTKLLQDLQMALYYQPEHLSLYQLNIEPHSIFYSHYPAGMLPQDQIADLTDLGQNVLCTQGYRHYEISAFTRKDSCQSKHNLNYWQFGDYLGIGAGAHSKITLYPEQQIQRYQKTRKPKDYLAKHGQANKHCKTLSTEDILAEFMLNTMRLKAGVSLALFRQRTGLTENSLTKKSGHALKKQLITLDHQRIKPTDTGMRYHNDLIVDYMP